MDDIDIRSTDYIIDITSTDYIIDVTVTEATINVDTPENVIAVTSAESIESTIGSTDYIIEITAQENNLVFELNSTGPRGPAGQDGTNGVPWTYVQEDVPVGGQSYTWFQPSTEYGHIWRGSKWDRMTTDDRLASSIETIILNGGYF